MDIDWKQEREQIKNRMKVMKMTPYRLAKMIGVQQSALGKILKGQTKNPGHLNVLRIREALLRYEAEKRLSQLGK
jgi:transcriptional regulator with XRE-family HTH domain